METYKSTSSTLYSSVCTNLAFSIVLVFLLMLCNCSYRYYAPSMQAVNGFKSKGELRLSAGASHATDLSRVIGILPLNPDVVGHEYQAGYSLGDHLSVSSALSFLNAQGTNNDIDGNGYVAEAGLGYFDHHSMWLWEFTSGGGFGKIENHSSDERIEIDFSRAYAQANLGVVPCRYFEIFAALKLVGMHYYDIHADVCKRSTEQDIGRLRSSPTFIHLEPSLTIRVGSKVIKGQIQLVPSFPLNNHWMEDHREKANVSFGITALLFRKSER